LYGSGDSCQNHFGSHLAGPSLVIRLSANSRVAPSTPPLSSYPPSRSIALDLRPRQNVDDNHHGWKQRPRSTRARPPFRRRHEASRNRPHHLEPGDTFYNAQAVCKFWKECIPGSDAIKKECFLLAEVMSEKTRTIGCTCESIVWILRRTWPTTQTPREDLVNCALVKRSLLLSCAKLLH
jgi:hypothetical protein